MPNATEYNILLTGVTGFIGRHILYEYLDSFLKNHLSGKIYVLIRNKASENTYRRLINIFKDDYIPSYLKRYSLDQILNIIEIVDGSLGDTNLSEKIKSVVPQKEKLYVIHCAGSVNLFNNKVSEQDIVYNNFNGTKNLLDSLNHYIYKLVFISTAFSCGIVKGILDNDYSGYYQNNEFRNPYEKYKNCIEKTIIDYCNKEGIEYQILRPSVTVGRMIDAPLYYVSKFDVIYGWTRFFWHIKENDKKEIIRIQMAADSKINIIPVDYVAKTVVRVFDSQIKYLNVVNTNSSNNRYLYGQMLNAIGFDNYIFVDKIPTDLSKNEKFYYRIIDKVYSPYLNNIDNEYETSFLKEIMRDFNINDINFQDLAQFAIKYDFDDNKVV